MCIESCARVTGIRFSLRYRVCEIIQLCNISSRCLFCSDVMALSKETFRHELSLGSVLSKQIGRIFWFEKKMPHLGAHSAKRHWKNPLKQACRDTCKFSHITIAGWELKSWIPWLTPQWVRLRAPLIFAHVTEPWRLEHTSCVLCVFSTCFVTYSTEADIKTVMKPWYDVDVTVYRLFSGLQIHASVMVKIGATLNL